MGYSPNLNWWVYRIPEPSTGSPKENRKKPSSSKAPFWCRFKRCVNQSLSLVGLSNPTSCKRGKKPSSSRRSFSSRLRSEVPGSPIFMMQLCSGARHIEVQIVGDQLLGVFFMKHGRMTTLIFSPTPNHTANSWEEFNSVFKMFETPRPWKSPSFLGDTIKMKKKQPATVVYRRLYLSFRFIFKWDGGRSWGMLSGNLGGSESGKEAIGRYSYGDFLKCWYPTTHGFPTKNDHFEAFWWYHHLRKHPYSWTWESISCERFCQSFLVMEDCNTAYLSKMRDSSMGDRFKPRSLFINFDHSEQETLWYSHYFHGHQPNSRGLHTHYKDSLLKVGWPSLLFHPSNWWRFAEMRAPVQQKYHIFYMRSLHQNICWVIRGS